LRALSSQQGVTQQCARGNRVLFRANASDHPGFPSSRRGFDSAPHSRLEVVLPKQEKLQNELSDLAVLQGLSHFGSALKQVKVPQRAARRGIHRRISSTRFWRAWAFPTGVPLMLSFLQFRTARPSNPEPKSTTDQGSGVVTGVMMFSATASSRETHADSPAPAPR
jgi:hypothetical protein